MDWINLTQCRGQKGGGGALVHTTMNIRVSVKTLYIQQTSLIQSNTQTNLDLRNTTLGYGFHFQHRNFRTFPVEDLAHDTGRTLVRAEYGYQKESPNTNS
jgi:hypothetical protein